MKYLKLAALAAAGMVLCAVSAFAATAPAAAAETSVPVGPWLAALVLAFQVPIVAIIVYAARKYLPPWAQIFATPALIENASNAAIADVAGAALNIGPLPISTVNAVVAAAVEWAKTNGEPLLLKWIGDTLEPLIIAYLSKAGVIPPEASKATLGAGKGA